MFKNRAIVFILITLMIDAIGVGIVFPIMPDLMARVGAGATGEGAFWGGLLMAAYAGALFLCGPVVGSLSDKIGRRPILIAALSMLALDYAIMALAGSFWLLLIGRTLAGLAGATYITATAYIADISSPEEKSANFGLVGGAFGIGFVLGPAIGGLAAEISLTAPFWLAAFLSGGNALFGYFNLPESLPKDKRRPFGKRDLNPFKSILDAFRSPGLAIPLICIFTFEFANLVYPTIWAFWSREVFGWSTLYIGLSLAVYGILLATFQAGLMPVILKWIGNFPTLMLGIAAAVISMIGFGFTSTLAALAIFIVLAAFSDLVPVLLTALASNTVDDNKQGVVQGVIASLSSVAAIISPLVMTALFQASVDPVGPYMPGAPFLFAAILVAGMMPLAIKLRGHRSG
ncbi:MFS transporter, DHA1 family, tetracycline resistance protein [Epibacterium ulvae]|uniref:MFS transporter, DHA1 family, tetracycline resistance protein n=1 Tax=Epibacterium ulvae TaxID=1156985 RepID=A0A1G5PVV2_9RHOB|nr:MFS transporter [Epibacterium ulvae]SCZ53775.1 MFS transporter, DHA1 family, tetracycline resistance protein [Epibacterium ulvae]